MHGFNITVHPARGFAKADAGRAAVLVNEFDTGCFECTPDDVQSRTP